MLVNLNISSGYLPIRIGISVLNILVNVCFYSLLFIGVLLCAPFIYFNMIIPIISFIHVIYYMIIFYIDMFHLMTLAIPTAIVIGYITVWICAAKCI